MPIPPEFAGPDVAVEISCVLRPGLTVVASRPLAELRRSPPGADIMRRRAKACQERHDEAGAAEWFGCILAAPIPEAVDAYDDALRFLVTAAEAGHRDPARAVALGEALVRHTHGRDARTWYTLALAQQLQGDRAAAERACLAALALRPGHTTILARLAAIRAMP